MPNDNLEAFQEFLDTHLQDTQINDIVIHGNGDLFVSKAGDFQKGESISFSVDTIEQWIQPIIRKKTCL